MSESQYPTKLMRFMQENNIKRQDLFNMVKEKYPDEPLSLDGISRIMHGKRTNYKVKTLIRICDALDRTPDELLDFEHVTSIFGLKSRPKITRRFESGKLIWEVRDPVTNKLKWSNTHKN